MIAAEDTRGLGAHGLHFDVVVLATRNRGKLGEFSHLLEEAPWRLLSLDEAPGGASVAWDESGSTYRQNATIKATAVWQATNLPALADDSGLELEALDGFPGVHSARWMVDGATAEQLRDAISQKVASLGPESRRATFVCVLALAVPDRHGGCALIYAEGSVRGTLLPEPRGRGGFGYDPIFVPLGADRTMAEMATREKDRWSHRGRATRELLKVLGGSAGATK